MNFFAHQDQARRRTRGLVLLFIAAVICILLVTNLVVIIMVANTGDQPQMILPGPAWIGSHPATVVITSVIVLLLIAGASGYRMAKLAGGGGTIARALGGTRLPTDPTDPEARRLRNTVEEIALAAGMPVPEIFVLEREEGINAFAAGHSASDAAISVSRGALQQLSRSELQGVVAHEFSHIANGDMRLNIKLVGLLFGILAIGLAGQQILRLGRHGRSRNGLPILALGLALMIIGFTGMFFGRLIQAAVSRQRELLADASAVQFTRDPSGIGGALKKIAAMRQGSELNTDTTEVAHMLFAAGATRRWFATHPPIEDRIRAIDPHFDPGQLQDLRTASDLGGGMEEPRAAGFAPPDSNARVPAAGLVERVGTLSWPQVAYASKLRESLPPALLEAAHSPSACINLILALLLDDNPAIRARQQDILRTALGADHAEDAEALHQQTRTLNPLYRLPLVELAIPACKRRPEAAIRRYFHAIERLVHADGDISPFEYALYHLARSQLVSSAVDDADRKTLDLREVEADLAVTLAVLARFGHRESDQARRAFLTGWEEIFPHRTVQYRAPANWVDELGRALDRLDRLRPLEKESVINALVSTLAHDGRVTLTEVELLRAICASLHCPMPPLLTAQAT